MKFFTLAFSLIFIATIPTGSTAQGIRGTTGSNDIDIDINDGIKKDTNESKGRLLLDETPALLEEWDGLGLDSSWNRLNWKAMLKAAKRIGTQVKNCSDAQKKVTSLRLELTYSPWEPVHSPVRVFVFRYISSKKTTRQYLSIGRLNQNKEIVISVPDDELSTIYLGIDYLEGVSTKNWENTYGTKKLKVDERYMEFKLPQKLNDKVDSKAFRKLIKGMNSIALKSFECD